ncbi:uncharacterized protein FOMMEDRAFT_25874 [Fomitiporia mediterranea MF3/22]|uniref:uncharacterized protein n=1 Tax=Fomitiporia mediterranea (strain MF3/22) TaxID=694068 RepID=UPI0004408B27|nr:uncharacterized protein FOMMEDRAFT_25874 [Fomitiporia mediterranea MF3/22]EJD06647.1 hypothetical protein FOMMEDRAFT_25874 [Fomitiporia mediterranea MF3/22]
MSIRPLPGDTSYVETGIRDELIFRYFSVAALALAGETLQQVYEYLITIGEEVGLRTLKTLPHPFKAPITGGIYMAIPVFNTESTLFCKSLPADRRSSIDDVQPIMVISSVLLLSCCYCAEITLSLRVYAVWGLNRIVLIILVIVIMCSAGGGYYMVVTFALSGSIVFGLLLVKAISYYCESGSFGTLLKTMLTGGATYFLCIISMAFTNLVMLLFKQGIVYKVSFAVF